MPERIDTHTVTVAQAAEIRTKVRTRPRRRSSLFYSESAYQDSDDKDQAARHFHSPPDKPSKPDLPLCSDCRWNSPFTTPASTAPGSPVVCPPVDSSPSAHQPPVVHSQLSNCIPSHVRKCSASSFAGSYEESLLSGRMAANTSSPVPFYAKLGALGRQDKHKKKLNKHLATKFDAIFYDWGDSADGSPYVGSIDLSMHYKDRANSSRLGYRIPRKGQIQLIISNLQKTAVKLFLVPYDLSDMDRNQKTVLRQKVYEITDGRQRLIQAIHIPIARPQDSNRYYLHGTVRVVFQNRINDTSSPMPGLKGPSTRVETVQSGFSTLHPLCANCGSVFD